MSNLATPLLLTAAMVAIIVAWIAGRWRGHADKAEALEMLWRYMRATEDVLVWCNRSAHAQLIAGHIRARGEGHTMNAGTPMDMEPCTISGLRAQLERLDRASPTAQPATPQPKGE